MIHLLGIGQPRAPWGDKGLMRARTAGAVEVPMGYVL